MEGVDSNQQRGAEFIFVPDGILIDNADYRGVSTDFLNTSS
jgi:hypothetical protein